MVGPTKEPKLIAPSEVEPAQLDLSGCLLSPGSFGSQPKSGEASGASPEAVEPRAKVADPLVVGEADETMATAKEAETSPVAQWVGEDSDEAGYTLTETKELVPPDSTSLALVRVDLAVGDGVMVAEEVDGGAEGPSGALDLDYSTPTEEGKQLVPAELEDPQSPIICTPLAMLEPSDTKGSERSKQRGPNG